MKESVRTRWMLTIVMLFFHYTSFSQKTGIFEGYTDIGENVNRGSATFVPETRQYIVSGAGNLLPGQDQCHFLWKKLKGDFILYTRAELPEIRVVRIKKLVGWSGGRLMTFHLRLRPL